MVDQPAVTVIGVADERLDLLAPEARHALDHADAVVGERRHLWLYLSWASRQPADERAQPETLEIAGDVDEVVRAVRHWALDGGRRVCILTSGDPGFFGIVRHLLRGIDRRLLRVVPGPAPVALAFARLGLPWDDAVVIPADGRELSDVVGVVRTARKAAVMTSPDVTPEALGSALLASGTALDLVAVCSRLGSAEEQVVELSIAELAEGRFDPLSVVVVVGPGGLPLLGWSPGGERVLAWGAPETAFDHGDGMITKAEVRAVVIGKLGLPARGVVWDVGAGSGSVAIECSLVRPGLTVMAVEHDQVTAARITANAVAMGASVHVVPGRPPDSLTALPDPDRVYVGGGGIEVLEVVLARLRPGGRVVATYAALDHAAVAAERLGSMTQLSVARGERLAEGGWRLASDNPVFVAWGPG